jgi:guanylate kinase
MLPNHEARQSYEDERASGQLLVITGFTAAGKSTLVENFLQTHPEYRRVITTTTRAPRKGETANDYNFVSLDEFDAMREQGELLEETVVVGDDGAIRCYGTPKSAIEGVFNGEKLIWVVDMMRVARLDEIFSKYEEFEALQLKKVTLPLMVTPPRLSLLKDRYFKRTTGQTTKEKRTSFLNRLRTDWAVCADPTSVFTNILYNEKSIEETTTALELLIISTFSSSN